jgi:hypothetical protein
LFISSSSFYFEHFYREGIRTDTLDEVEAQFVHPTLKASIEGDENVLMTDGIGS